MLGHQEAQEFLFCAKNYGHHGGFVPLLQYTVSTHFDFHRADRIPSSAPYTTPQGCTLITVASKIKRSLYADARDYWR